MGGASDIPQPSGQYAVALSDMACVDAWCLYSRPVTQATTAPLCCHTCPAVWFQKLFLHKHVGPLVPLVRQCHFRRCLFLLLLAWICCMRRCPTRLALWNGLVLAPLPPALLPELRLQQLPAGACPCGAAWRLLRIISTSCKLPVVRRSLPWWSGLVVAGVILLWASAATIPACESCHLAWVPFSQIKPCCAGFPLHRARVCRSSMSSAQQQTDPAVLAGRRPEPPGCLSFPHAPQTRWRRTATAAPAAWLRQGGTTTVQATASPASSSTSSSCQLRPRRMAAPLPLSCLAAAAAQQTRRCRQRWGGCRRTFRSWRRRLRSCRLAWRLRRRRQEGQVRCQHDHGSSGVACCPAFVVMSHNLVCHLMCPLSGSRTHAVCTVALLFPSYRLELPSISLRASPNM